MKQGTQRMIKCTFGYTSRGRRRAHDHEAAPSCALAFFVPATLILFRRLTRAL